MPSPAEIFAAAVAQLRQGQKKAAADLLERFVAAVPRDGRGWFLLGSLRAELGAPAQALPMLRRAVEIAPNDPDYLNNYGAALLLAFRPAEAITALHAATRLRPVFPEAWRSLGQALFDARRLGESVTAFRRALAQAPTNAAAWNGLAGALLAGYADYAGARDAYAKTLEYNPDFVEARSNLLMLMNYDPAASAQEQFEASVAWAERHASGIPAAIRKPVQPHRTPLRLGIASSDLHDHSVARFLLPLLTQLDRRKFFIALYADREIEDPVRARLRGLADLWRDTAALGAAQMAQRIADDDIDILIDLSGHTARKPLLAIAARPARVQISWLGYPATTGLPTIDYRLTDAIADPGAAAQQVHTETLVRLDPSFLCFDALHTVAERSIDPEPRPPIFGSFNNLLKLSAPALETWSAILRRLPDARLAFKAQASDDATTRAHFEKRFAEHGVEKSRLTWLPYAATTAAHLRAYDHIDVALDTFPYNGTTTTCEALWMGVPVVALRGDRHVARVSASLLTTIGRPEWIAETRTDYIEIASRLAQDRAALSDFRRTLRPQMQASPLCDAPGFARRFEAALESMWAARTAAP